MGAGPWLGSRPRQVQATNQKDESREVEECGAGRRGMGDEELKNKNGRRKQRATGTAEANKKATTEQRMPVEQEIGIVRWREPRCRVRSESLRVWRV